jgi:hypothetical protein
MKFRRKAFKVSTKQDIIPLHSLTALKMCCMAIRKYESDLADEYEKYFALAKAALNREQATRSGPNQIKIQWQGAYAGNRYGNNMI